MIQYFYSVIALFFLLIIVLKYKSIKNVSILNFWSVSNWVKHGKYHNFNGHAIFYRDSLGATTCELGKRKVAQLPILLLIHGFPMFSFDFIEIYEYMRLDFHVVCLDMLGAGFSDKPSDIEYTFGIQADVIDSVLKEIIYTRSVFSDNDKISCGVNIVSHDIGVSVAHELIARQFESKSTFYFIKSNIYLNGGLFADSIRKIVQTISCSKLFGPWIHFLITRKGFVKSTASLYGPGNEPNDGELDIYWYALLHKGGLNLWYKFTNYRLDRLKHKERFQTAMIKISTLYPCMHINGPSDVIAGSHMAMEFQSKVPAGRLVYLSKSVGHFPHLEDFGEMMRAITPFLNEVNKIQK